MCDLTFPVRMPVILVAVLVYTATVWSQAAIVPAPIRPRFEELVQLAAALTSKDLGKKENRPNLHKFFIVHYDKTLPETIRGVLEKRECRTFTILTGDLDNYLPVAYAIGYNEATGKVEIEIYSCYRIDYGGDYEYGDRPVPAVIAATAQSLVNQLHVRMWDVSIEDKVKELFEGQFIANWAVYGFTYVKPNGDFLHLPFVWVPKRWVPAASVVVGLGESVETAVPLPLSKPLPPSKTLAGSRTRVAPLYDFFELESPRRVELARQEKEAEDARRRAAAKKVRENKKADLLYALRTCDLAKASRLVRCGSTYELKAGDEYPMNEVIRYCKEDAADMLLALALNYPVRDSTVARMDVESALSKAPGQTPQHGFLSFLQGLFDEGPNHRQEPGALNAVLFVLDTTVTIMVKGGMLPSTNYSRPADFPVIQLSERLQKVRERFAGRAPDADEITLAVGPGVDCAQVLRALNVILKAGFLRVGLAKADPGKERGKPIPVGCAGIVAGRSKSSDRISAPTDGFGKETVNDIIGGLMDDAASDTAHSGSVALTEPEIACADRQKASVMRVVLQNLAAIRYEYNRRVREKPSLAGTVTVKFSIDEFGKVVECSIAESTVGDEMLESKLTTKIKRWQFDPVEVPGSLCVVTYPFEFRTRR